MGSDAFRDQLIRRLGKVVEGKERASYSGEAIKRHDESQAEECVQSGMRILGLRDEDLGSLAKGHELKCLLAWLSHSQTMVSHPWISRRLQMGRPSNLSEYIKGIRETTDQRLLGLRRRLEKKILK